MSRATVAAMTAYTLELREARTKLNQNESPFDLPQDLKKQLMEQLIRRDWNRYPDFESSTLRNALAAAYGLEPENILVGNGSNELLAASIGTFVGPGTPVIIPRPTFTLYEKLVTVAGGNITWVDIDPTTGVLPVDGIVKAAKGMDNAVIIVCSPNNPTGGVLPEDGIQRLLGTGATVLFDRAYGDFARQPEGFGRTGDAGIAADKPQDSPGRSDVSTTPGLTRLAKDLPPLHDRLVTFCTFSKAWAMAGLRVGWLASTAGTAREIRKVKLPYSLNIVSEAAAAMSLRYSHFRDRNVARIIGERERLVKELQTIGVEVFPTRANFVSFRTAKPAKEVFEQLIERGVLIRDISGYYGLAKCLRVSVGTPVENDAFLQALKEIL